MVRWLFKVGALADVIVSDRCASSPLLCATYRGHLNVAQLLYDSGAAADVYSENASGVSPLSLCVAAGRDDAVKWLLVHGAGCDPRSGRSDAPFLSRLFGKVQRPRGREGLFASVKTDLGGLLRAHAAFIGTVLLAVSCARGHSSPLHIFQGYEASLLRLVADFSEIPTGRELRHVRECLLYLAEVEKPKQPRRWGLC